MTLAAGCEAIHAFPLPTHGKERRVEPRQPAGLPVDEPVDCARPPPIHEFVGNMLVQIPLPL
eukprot:SAG31_NODE_42127_length_273_cov_0.586207_1_plen_61_part_01